MLLIIIYAAIMIVSVLLMVRNNKVLNFSLFITRKVFAFDWKTDEEFRKKLEYADYISDKIDYDKMLLSFKPLTLEAWFTEEEIYFIKNQEFIQ